ncbi:unnamed protein product [Tenebrio molitor]|nr:unnamed protein product [Tenebrio molitor]
MCRVPSVSYTIVLISWSISSWGISFHAISTSCRSDSLRRML